MGKEQLFAVEAASSLRERFRASTCITGLSSHINIRSKAVPLFFFVTASVVTYVAFVLSLFFFRCLSFFKGIRRVVLRDCCIF